MSFSPDIWIKSEWINRLAVIITSPGEAGLI